ncbi:MAG: hypothetical protein DSZ29_02145 [Aquificaceae bacterium]|nr:MAG: hypothetical protein DSZ29_02145 [Aquificaceae bacterium]
MEIEDEKLTFYYNGNQDLESFQILQTALDIRGYYLVEFYNEFLIDIYMLLDDPESKHIAIDWDNTISADQDFFKNLIKQFQSAGYKPFVCTLRAPDRENIEEIRSILEKTNIAIYLTDGNPKREYMKELGVNVHLWIDDFYPGVCRETSSLLTRNSIE